MKVSTKHRVNSVRKILAKGKMAGLFVRVFEGDNQNVHYLSGFSGTTAVILITAKKSFIITDARYYARAQEEAPDFELVKVERGKRISEFVNVALAKAGLTKQSKIGFEAGHISVEVLGRLRKELKCTLVPTVHMIERLRQYKDASEIALLRKACRATCRVYDEVVQIIRPGMTESELSFEIDMRLRKHGAVANSFTNIIGSGPNSAIPHYATGNRKLRAGEPVVMDFGGLYPGGYCSDITRTVFVPGKKPSAEMQEIYNHVLAANKAAFKALKPGMMWKEFDGIARKVIDDAGYGKYFTHGLGHSVGLLVHDPYDYENDAFEVGTVITDEPGIYIEGVGGVRIEDDLVVTEDGAERLTIAPYWKF